MEAKKHQKAEYALDKANLEKIEANQATLETCLNEENSQACTSLPDNWNVEYKGKTIKDFSIPLSYLQLHSLYTEKMPIDEQKVLRNLNEYLIRDGIVQGVAVKNGDIKSIHIGDAEAVNGSAIFFSVPLTFSIEFDRVEDLISFVRNVEKKLISFPNDRILYKIQQVSYDIVTSTQPQTTTLEMIAYYYHDSRFADVEQSQSVEEAEEEVAGEVTVAHAAPTATANSPTTATALTETALTGSVSTGSVLTGTTP
ncbi:MAG: hypothetical protein LBU27_07520 [Candidatus Peribacteria bacterium]|nr:hypothetical protein [Candidatus Peribacteria bacterium]